MPDEAQKQITQSKLTKQADGYCQLFDDGITAKGVLSVTDTIGLLHTALNKIADDHPSIEQHSNLLGLIERLDISTFRKKLSLAAAYKDAGGLSNFIITLVSSSFTKNKDNRPKITDPITYYFCRILIHALDKLENSPNSFNDTMRNQADEISKAHTKLMGPLTEAASEYYQQVGQTGDAHHSNPPAEEVQATELVDESSPMGSTPDLPTASSPEPASESYLTSTFYYLWSIPYNLLQPIVSSLSGEVETNSLQSKPEPDVSSATNEQPEPDVSPATNEQPEPAPVPASSELSPISTIIHLSPATLVDLKLLKDRLETTKNALNTEIKRLKNLKQNFNEDISSLSTQLRTINSLSSGLTNPPIDRLSVNQANQIIKSIIDNTGHLAAMIDPIMNPTVPSPDDYKQACSAFGKQIDTITQRKEDSSYVYNVCLSTALNLCLIATDQDNNRQFSYKKKLNSRLSALQHLDSKLYRIFYKLKLAIENWFTKKTTRQSTNNLNASSLSTQGVFCKPQQPKETAAAKPAPPQPAEEPASSAHQSRLS
jgi:hypothetical protein